MQGFVQFLVGVLDQSGWMMCDALELNPDLLTVGILVLVLLGSVVTLRMLVLFAKVNPGDRLV